MNNNLSNRQVFYGPAVPLFNYNHNHDPKNGQFTSGDGGGDSSGRFTATGGYSGTVAGDKKAAPSRDIVPPPEDISRFTATREYSGTIAGQSGKSADLKVEQGAFSKAPSGAIRRAMNLPLNSNADRRNGTPTNPYISHYGGNWDPNKDSNTNPPPGSRRKPTGNHDNELDEHSLAISANVAQANNLKVGDKVYINGQYLGNYDDTAPEDNTIDVYDPTNVPKDTYWGGTVRGGTRITRRR